MYTNHITKTKNGYSLVEVLIAVAILMIAIVGPLTIAAKSIQSSQYARQQVTAYFLAQEGVSLVHVIRNDQALAYADDPQNVNAWAWASLAQLDSCFVNDGDAGCNIDARDPSLLSNVSDCSTSGNCVMEFASGTGNPTLTTRFPLYVTTGVTGSTPYTRVITLQTVTPDEIELISTVSWNSNLLGGQQQVQVVTSLFNTNK